MKWLIVILIILILLFLYYHNSSEHFTIINELTGVYTLSPKFDSSIIANRAISLSVLPQTTVSPDYLDLTIRYANGKTKMVRTNLNVGNIFTYFNDYSNVQYLTDPSKIQYDLHTDSGLFRALTAVTENGTTTLKLMDYQITSRVSY